MIDLFWGIAIPIFYGVIGSLIAVLVQHYGSKINQLTGSYSGIWEDEIYDENGSIIKKDRFELRQEGELLKGTIVRFYPEEQSHRRYFFSGRIRLGIFFAIFWSQDRSIPSNGSWYLRQAGDDEFEGYYFKLDQNNPNNVVPVPIRLKRVRRLEQPYWMPNFVLRWVRG